MTVNYITQVTVKDKALLPLALLLEIVLSTGADFCFFIPGCKAESWHDSTVDVPAFFPASSPFAAILSISWDGKCHCANMALANL